jgi:hypothetical protein
MNSKPNHRKSFSFQTVWSVILKKANVRASAAAAPHGAGRVGCKRSFWRPLLCQCDFGKLQKLWPNALRQLLNFYGLSE